MKFDKFCIRCLLAPPDRCPSMSDSVRHLSDTCLVDANTLDIRNFSFSFCDSPFHHSLPCNHSNIFFSSSIKVLISLNSR